MNKIWEEKLLDRYLKDEELYQFQIKQLDGDPKLLRQQYAQSEDFRVWLAAEIRRETKEIFRLKVYVGWIKFLRLLRILRLPSHREDIFDSVQDLSMCPELYICDYQFEMARQLLALTGSEFYKLPLIYAKHGDLIFRWSKGVVFLREDGVFELGEWFGTHIKGDRKTFSATKAARYALKQSVAKI